MDSFTPDVAGALDGPAWLRTRRSAAAELLAATPRPTADDEVWRYSRIGELDLSGLRPVGGGAAAASERSLRDEPCIVDAPAARLTLVDGVLREATVDPDLVAAGVYVGALVDAPGAEQLLGSAMTEPTDAFAIMNDAYVVDAVAVVVPAGVTVGGPIVIEHLVVSDAVAVFPRLVISAGDDAQVRVVEVYRSGESRAFVGPVVELVAAPAARVGYLAVQQLGRATWQVGSVVARAEAAASVHASLAGLGGDYARVRTDCRLVGRGATGTITALYFGDGTQMLDFRTFQDHAAPDTSSTLLFKGAVDDESASVYTGLIRVRKHARGTNALQTNRNIKLSEAAWAESVPNLEIENNDVRCKHESAVSPIDADQRFYLESRGVPPQVAERLVVQGFFREVADHLAVPEVRATLDAAVAAKLDKLSVASEGERAGR
jgi:Fe-S cluster assembly protein SufD